MALVAYDNSDSSDFEDEDQDTTSVVTINNKVQETTEPIKENEATPRLEQIVEPPTSVEGSKLFNLLPRPSSKKPQVIEEDDEFLHKKEANVLKPKAKITVPSLSDFKDVESSVPAAKPRVGNGKKSGLLSILPQPRNGVKATANSFLPYALTQKSNNTNVKKKEPLPTPVKKHKIDPKPVTNDSDDSDNDGVENDFFSMNKPVEIPTELVPLDIDLNINKTSKTHEEPKAFNIESYFKPKYDENDLEQSNVHVNSDMDYAEASSSYSNGYEERESNSNSNEAVLDEEAILKLCGARGKRRREDIEIVDVNQQEILAGAREMLLKGLMDDTTKRVSVSKKRGNEPTSQQKRKHQITYLAHQAKANEAELQNQWANNRMSKRQTQSKYGF